MVQCNAKTEKCGKKFAAQTHKIYNWKNFFWTEIKSSSFTQQKNYKNMKKEFYRKKKIWHVGGEIIPNRKPVKH